MDTMAHEAPATPLLAFRYRCSKRVAWGPGRRRDDRSLRDCGTTYIRLLRACLNQLLLKEPITSEELVVRLTVLLGLVLDQGKFDGAEVIRHLLEAVIGHRGLAASDDPF